MGQGLITPTLPVEVRYVSANERLLAQLMVLIDRLTNDGKPFTLFIVGNGRTIDLWQGHKSGRTQI